MNAHGDSQWVTEKDLQSLMLECANMYPSEQPAETAERKLKEAAPVAVLRLAHIAAHGEPAQAVKAAQIILDYTIGAKRRVAAGSQSPVEMAKDLYEQALEMSGQAVKPWDPDN